MGTFRAFLRNTDGATAIEYALVAGSIALIIIVAVRSVGTLLAVRFNTIATDLS